VQIAGVTSTKTKKQKKNSRIRQEKNLYAEVCTTPAATSTAAATAVLFAPTTQSGNPDQILIRDEKCE
jgi:hypothetical protein